MSQFYNGVKQQLLEWALGEKPPGVVLRMVVVSQGYEFDADDDGTGLTESNVIWDGAVDGTANLGVVDLDDMGLQNIAIGVVVKGFIFYFDWPEGVKLICFIDQTQDMVLPFTTISDQLDIRWADEGVFRI